MMKLNKNSPTLIYQINETTIGLDCAVCKNTSKFKIKKPMEVTCKHCNGDLSATLFGNEYLINITDKKEKIPTTTYGTSIPEEMKSSTEIINQALKQLNVRKHQPPFSTLPNFRERRDVSKDEYKAAHRYCRITGKILKNQWEGMRLELTKQFYDMAIYGTSVCRVDKSGLEAIPFSEFNKPKQNKGELS